MWIYVPVKKEPHPFICHQKWFDMELRLEFHSAIVTVIHMDLNVYYHSKHHLNTKRPVLMDWFINLYLPAATGLALYNVYSVPLKVNLK